MNYARRVLSLRQPAWETKNTADYRAHGRTNRPNSAARGAVQEECRRCKGRPYAPARFCSCLPLPLFL